MSAAEFNRIAKEREADGIPMVEKTIFIVKPIFVHADPTQERKKPQKKSKN